MDIQAGKVTSSPWHGGDGEKSHQGKESHIREEESPWHSSIIGDFWRAQVNTNKFSAANPIGFEYIILMSCVAWPNETPIGTASNFLQCKWVSCSKSYWQGYDLGWYKDMGAPCFLQASKQAGRQASKQHGARKQQGAARSSKQQASSRQAADEQQVSSRWAAGEQQVSSSKQQQAAASKSNQRLPLEKMIKYKF